MTWPRVVVIDEEMKMPDRVATLKGVLSPENTNRRQTIHICADINLTGEGPFAIGDCRKLIAPKGFARSPGSRGPCVYTDEMYSEGNESGRGALFRVHGDNVLISGFQLKGPNPDIGMGDRQHEKGILISPPALAVDENDQWYALPPIRNIVISNMEIYHWSGVGVQVDDNAHKDDDPRKNVPRGRLNNIWPGPGAVRVVGCYFHHNRRGPGEGYGVNSAVGAYVTIEQNVFDENRHAIAGNPENKAGGDYSGYTVRDNLILAGGGVHIYYDYKKVAGYAGIFGAIVGGIIGGIFGGLAGAALGAAIGAAAAAALAGGVVAAGLVAWQTHQIDMHGTKSDFRSLWPKGQACCGTAGETLIIERNTVMYDGHKTRRWMLSSGPAIKIRGNPIDKAVAISNVFRHKNDKDAIHQNGEGTGIVDIPTNPIQGRANNTYNAYDYLLPNYWGKGDFYGSYENPYHLDDFMATGVTWWARSPVTEQWRYLNTMPEQINELWLEKADDDAIWDVTRRYNPPGELESYSKSGRSSWQTLIRMPPVPPR